MTQGTRKKRNFKPSQDQEVSRIFSIFAFFACIFSGEKKVALFIRRNVKRVTNFPNAREILPFQNCVV